MSKILAFAAQARQAVRNTPLVHKPVHWLAVGLSKTRWGARFIREVLTTDAVAPSTYQEWVARYDTLTEADRDAMLAHIERFERRPVISVVMPAYNTSENLIRAAIDSVRGQLYPHWELCIADDASPDPRLWRVLREYAERDRRIKIVRRPTNGHICAATNSALELATGEFVALMDHDDVLPGRALYEVAALLQSHPDADLIYSDEDKIDDHGRRFEPYFKTDWNSELMLGQNMINHLAVYRRALIDAVGGLREGFEGSQEFDLALRVSERTTAARIHHIPWVLYHWRQQGSTASFSESFMTRCAEAAKVAVTEHLERTGQRDVQVSTRPEFPGWVQVRRLTPEPKPLVSVIIPTRDRAELLAQCVEGLLTKTAYPHLEVLIVDNDSVEPETMALFERLSADARVRVIAAPGPFNFSALNNRAAAEAKGEILLLLNNDISMIHDDWLDELVGQAVRPNVGAVGCKLLYPNDIVQHGGVILGVGQPPPVAGHSGHGAHAADPGHFGHLALPRNVSAVTAACLALRKSVFEEVGGLDETGLKVAFNDVDLCLKIRAASYDIVHTPFATLYHHESASRGAEDDPVKVARFQSEIQVMRKRWAAVLDNDPFYGPMLDKLHGNYAPAFPPARTQPWLQAPPKPARRAAPKRAKATA